MRIILKFYAASVALMLVSACGGGNNPASMQPGSANFDLQAGIKEMVANGLSSNVTFSGTAMVDGVSTAFTGSGTFARSPATPVTFNGMAASCQTTVVTGTVTAAGQSTAYSTTVTDYYDSGDGALLGEASAAEYDVASSPIQFPTSVVGGSSGILGTLSRYTDSTMSVSLGSTQVSYLVNLAPVDPGSPVGVAVTLKVYDTQNTLIETDVANYTLTSTGVIALSGATAQDQSGELTLTAN